MNRVSSDLVVWFFLVIYCLIEYWIDIPNLKAVDLPRSFEKVKTKSISSIIMNMNKWIDVSPILADIVRISLTIGKSKHLNRMNTNVKDLVIPSNSYNEFESLDLNKCKWLKSLVIGSDCFMRVDVFLINGLNHLKSLKIESNSFTHLKSNDKWDWDIANNSSRSFHILNCIELESIEIGEYSFSDYGGLFELKNLPKLSTIKIGEIESVSNNFYWSSFEIKGIINMILIMNRSSKFEFHWIR